MKPIVAKIYALKDAAGLDQQDVEAACGLPRSRLWKWSIDQGEPTAYQAAVLAKYFGVTLEWLVDDAKPADEPVTPLTPEEGGVLGYVRALGVDESMRRLLRPIPAATKPGEEIPLKSRVEKGPK
jgi:transcriptional regulator with XRE-family HTH domain